MLQQVAEAVVWVIGGSEICDQLPDLSACDLISFMPLLGFLQTYSLRNCHRFISLSEIATSCLQQPVEFSIVASF